MTTESSSRRSFLRAAPLAAATTLPLLDAFAALAQTAQTAGSAEQVAAAAQPFKLWTAQELDADRAALAAKPGDDRLYESKSIPVQIILTTERHKLATEFEFHEGRDHVLIVLDGATTYEVGGTPTGIRPLGPGEWHSAGSDGAKTLHLAKGDMLLIPRGTLHKRSTEDSVTFFLISNPAPKP